MARSSEKSPSVIAARLQSPAGGGAFSISGVSIGVFLIDQPDHRISLGSDKPVDTPLSAQQGWLLPAGAQGVCEFDEAHEFLSVEISAELLAEVGLDRPAHIAPVFGAIDPLALQMSKTLATLSDAAPTLYRQTMDRALAAHVAQLAGEASPDVQAIEDVRLRRAISYINDNLANDLSLETLAAEAAMSPFHFARAFKKATGRSPLQYAIKERLDLAMMLLKTTALPVAEIAHRVGYEDVSRFGKHFKRHFNNTPGSVRA